jgi:TPR repeat protein
MDWIEGKTLDKYLRDNINDKYSLEILVCRFSQLAKWLIPQPFAHGDLKPDNILVRADGTLILVDYDGMYFPVMKGQKARELGSTNFRHPLRTVNDFDEHIDDFSFVLILLSIKAVSLDPWLLDENVVNGLPFTEKDFMNISNSDKQSWITSLISDDFFASVYEQFLLALVTQRFDIGSNSYLSSDNLAQLQYKIGVKYFKIGQYQKSYTIFRILSYEEDKYGNNGLGICFANGYCGCYEDKITEDYHHTDKKEYRAYMLSQVCFEKSAETGFVPALCNFGISMLLYYGDSYIQMFQKAIDKGDMNSRIMLGICYFYGWGFDSFGALYSVENAQKSYQLLIEPAEKGNRIAQSYLGRICYQDGSYLHSFQDAFYWFNEAAKQNDPIAQCYLACCYEELENKECVYNEDGIYFLKYNVEIEKWYKESARNGFWEAQLSVGELYMKRFRANKKNVKYLNKAVAWMTKAADQGYNYANGRLADLFYELRMENDFEKYARIYEESHSCYNEMFKKEFQLEIKDFYVWFN